jgi:1-acyl-sn-glycerol-3-phosphate acyltransferase
MGAGVPIIPTIIWGSQRIWTKGIKRNLKRNNFPVTVVFGEPILYERGADVEQAELHMRQTLLSMLYQVQENYPDSHVGQRWAPARLGGTAPAPLN